MTEKKCRKCKTIKNIDSFEKRGTKLRTTCKLCTTHSCYIVTDEKRKRFYRGYTTDLERRIRQHQGLRSGGARATKRFQNPVFALIVRGFPSERLALRFEKLMKIHRPRAHSLKQAIIKAKHLTTLLPFLHLPLTLEETANTRSE